MTSVRTDDYTIVSRVELAQLKQDLAEKTETIQRLERQRDADRMVISDHLARIEQLTADKLVLVQKIQELEQFIVDMRAEHSKEVKEMREVHATEIGELKSENAQLKTEIGELKSENAQLKATITVLTAKIDRLEQPIHGRTMAKSIEVYILKTVLMGIDQFSCVVSLKDATKFLDKVRFKRLDEDQQEMWDQFADKDKLMRYYTKPVAQKLQSLAKSIWFVKDLGNQVAHPGGNVSREELIAYYRSVCSADEFEHFAALCAYQDANMIGV